MLREPPNILIADDEQHMRVLLKMILEKLGYVVIAEASNGEETIKLYNQTKPDLVMLDINMPLKTGLNVLEELENNGQKACIIMMTSLSDLETVEKCLDLGAYGYIRKDTPVNQMMQIIKEAWEDFIKEDEEVCDGISKV